MPPNIRVFSNESSLCMRWPKYWSFSFSIIPSKEHPRLISFRMDWLISIYLPSHNFLLPKIQSSFPLSCQFSTNVCSVLRYYVSPSSNHLFELVLPEWSCVYAGYTLNKFLLFSHQSFSSKSVPFARPLPDNLK